MSRVPEGARQSGSPQLKPQHTGGAELVVVTITAVTFQPSAFGNREQQPVLKFAEFPDNELRVGKRGTDRLCESFGDETDDWVGQSVPLLKTREDVGRNTYHVYQVAPVEQWKALFRRHTEATGTATKRTRATKTKNG